MTTVLVTGGAGFIGSHVCEALLKKGDSVIVLDSMTEADGRNEKQSNLQAIQNAMPNANLNIILGDIRDSNCLNEIFLNHSIDLVIHLAACAGVRPSIEDPMRYYDVNVTGTLCLAETMRKHGVLCLVFASSSSVYGNHNKQPFSESDAADWPISPYAASKKAGELLLYSYHHLHKFSVSCLRFFTVYGPRQRPDLAIRKFAERISCDQAIDFYGDGLTKRDYTYISDITDGVIKACDWTMRENETSGYEIFNLGGSHSVSLRDMVSAVEKAVGKKAICNYLLSQPGDVTLTSADIQKAQRILGYNPQVSLEKGVALFVDWLKENLV